MPVSDVAVTVPAHWRPSVVDILRRNLRGNLPVVSDATAALTALRANPGLPTHGVIVLCDFGGSGASITLADAARDFSQFGETVRFADFSGDHIDQALLTHVVAGLRRFATPTRQAPRWSDHWCGCATNAGGPRNDCPRRPRRPSWPTARPPRRYPRHAHRTRRPDGGAARGIPCGA